MSESDPWAGTSAWNPKAALTHINPVSGKPATNVTTRATLADLLGTDRTMRDLAERDIIVAPGCYSPRGA